jgi:hypothetical protein
MPDPRQPHSTSLVRVLPCSPDGGEPTCHMLQLTVDKSLLDAWKKMTIIGPGGTFRVYDVPPGGVEPAPGKPSLSGKKVTVKQGYVGTVTYAGQNLNQVKRVSFNGKDLTAAAGNDGKSLLVSLTNDVTANAGENQLLLHIDATTLLPAPISVMASQTSTAPAKPGQDTSK